MSFDNPFDRLSAELSYIRPIIDQVAAEAPSIKRTKSIADLMDFIIYLLSNNPNSLKIEDIVTEMAKKNPRAKEINLLIRRYDDEQREENIERLRPYFKKTNSEHERFISNPKREMSAADRTIKVFTRLKNNAVGQ